MSKLIALQSGTHEVLFDAWNSDFSKLKQHALLFDQIGIFKLSQFYKTLGETLGLYDGLVPNTSNKTKSIIAVLKWLQQTGIIFEVNLQEVFQDQAIGNLSKKVSTQTFKDMTNLFKKIAEIQASDLITSEDEIRKAELLKEQHFAALRLMSIIMEVTKGVTAVTTFPHTEYTRKFPDSRKGNVVQVVINKLPFPNNETPWEQIIDYRNATENQKNLLSLRRWLRKISSESLSPMEIEEELEWLINEFQNHMRLHKMKANTETLEVMVKAPLEILEDLIKLKFSKIPEPLFALKKRQINLLEAELNAPGREMAYIIKTRDAFQSQE